MDFIKELNLTLYSDYNNLCNNIMHKSTSTITHFQIFMERLLKIINDKEKIVVGNKLGLGSLISDSKYINYLKTNFSFSEDMIINVHRINNFSNDHKHEMRSEFDEKEIKKMYRLTMYSAINIYNKCNNKNISLKNIDEKFNKILNSREISLKKIREEIELEKSKEFTNKEKELQKLKQAIEIQKQALINSEVNKKEHLKNINEIQNLKAKIIEKENIIDKLNENNKNVEKIRTIQIENDKLKENLKELENKKLIGTTVLKEKLTSYENNIKELEEEIRLLEDSLIKFKKNENDNLFEEKMKLERKLVFSNSYIEEDVPFYLRNLSKQNNSKSKYKQFYAVLYNILQRGQLISKSDYLDNEHLEKHEYKEIFRLQMLILNLIRNNKLSDIVWKINYINGNLKLISLAINDIFNYIIKLTNLTDISYLQPKIELKNNEYIDDDLVVNVEYGTIDLSNPKNIFYIEDKEIYVLEGYVQNNEIILHNIWIEDDIKYNIKDYHKKDLEWFLNLIFNHKNFREGQYEIIRNSLNGFSTIGILPTGSGKSIVYQLSVILQPKMAIVIAPTIELIKDQVRTLKIRHNITCISAIYNDKSSNYNKIEEENNFKNVNCLFTFVSPERFQNKRFRSTLMELEIKNAFNKIIFDEVHCLSEWGHDFRIAYLMSVPTIKQYCNSLQYLGLTATASKKVVKDLMVELEINKNNVVFNKTNKRENLTFSFKKFKDQEELDENLILDINNSNIEVRGKDTNSVLIFAKTHSKVDKVFEMLSNKYRFGDKVSRYYSDKNGNLSTEDFINDNTSILVSTKAFGMGIDKPNIKKTFHYGLPASLESFYQEAGRAGREQNSKAECKIFTYEYSKYEEYLINKFFNPNTSIQDLKELIKDPSPRIYEENKFCYKDIATNFRFLIEDIIDPLKEAKEIRNFYHKIYQDIKNNIVEVISNQNDKKVIEKKLYLLHKCGIVENWEVEYENKLIFKVIFNEQYKDLEYIKNTCINYIKSYQDDNEKYINSINTVTEYNKIDEIFYAVKHWYYENFIRTRITQLRNIYFYVTQEFANRNCSDEIQSTIDKFFDISNMIENFENNSFAFENETYEEIIRKISIVKDIKNEIISYQSLMEEVDNNKIKLYLSLLSLRNDDFDSMYGEQMMISSLNSVNEDVGKSIFVNIGKYIYSILSSEQKLKLLAVLYNINKHYFKTMFLENVKNDEYSKIYWLPFINEELKKVEGKINE